MTSPSQPTTLPAETVNAVQRALVAEHAAVWVYGLASAFLPGSFSAALATGQQAHTTRRDATVSALRAAGSTPKTAEVAYLTPQPVTNQASALAVLAVAEDDAVAAWHSVLENTTDATVRGTALSGMTDCAERGTTWRRAAGKTPSAAALPGMS